MRLILLLIFVVSPSWSEESPLPPTKDISNRYVAVDAFRDEVLDQKTNVVTKRVVRYYMKNPTVINFGNRPMMAGEGVKDWPAVVYIPVDAIVAIAGFTNNQQFAQILGTSSVVPEFHSTPR